MEPFQVTYWKTLPRGYQVSCQVESNYYYSKDDFPSDSIESYEQASQWYENIKKWYTEPKFD